MSAITASRGPATPAHRIAPHNIELEQALLGAILVNNEAFYRVSDFLEPRHFYEPINQKIFEILADLVRARKVATPTTVKTHLSADINVAGLTINQYLARLAAEATTVINAVDYGRDIYDLASRRRLIEIGEDMIAAALREAVDLNPRSLATDAIEVLDEIATANLDSRVTRKTIGEAAEESIHQACERRKHPGALRGVSYGLKEIDKITDGLQADELTVLAGRPGMGKSAVAVSIALRAAMAGHPALFFSLEMTACKLADRAITDLCDDGRRQPIEYSKFTKGDFDEAQWECLDNASRSLRGVPLVIDEESALTMSQIAARARKHQQALARKSKALSLVIVDHIHIMKASNRYAGDMVGEVTEITGGIKALAKNLGVPVLALAQLSRQCEGRDSKRPQLSDLRQSGSIEQDADVVIFAFREAYYLKDPCSDSIEEADRLAKLDQVKHRLELNIAKQRQGPTGTIVVFFDVASNAVRNLTERPS